ncbi:MAG: bifunctional oligoribonuclease/PAP phosphatase NrnA [Candidatus Omnitrophica bacterium]|nr:bifunctional oligoribonuclease/PAP phosphatase NrnA [Candidatus Omnitrophota bacterium]
MESLKKYTTKRRRKARHKNDSLAMFCRALKNKDNFLLASHVSPEGDAIGSILALESLLRRLGKKTLIACEDPFPERLACLPAKRWRQVKEVPEGRKFDALVVADCPTLERVGSVQSLLAPTTEIFNIDHHISNTHFGHYNYIRPSASAAGEVVYDIFKWFKMKLNQEEATCLYVSISTDTGSFKYSNTTVKSHQIASELIQTGIDIEKINDELYATYSLEKIQLYSLLLGKVQRSPDGTIAWVGLTRNDLKRTGATYEDTEGFIDFLKYIKEVQFAFFMSEMDGSQDGQVKVSFRSRGDYDVAQVAAYFGGGGHKKAAGCTIHGTLEEATRKILEQIKLALAKQNQKTSF